MPKTIDPDRLVRFAEVHLRSGQGTGGNGTVDVCFMQAVDWLTGGTGKTDAPECVDPTIRAFGIRLNDAARFADYRDELKAYAVRVVGTKTTAAVTKQRAFMCTDWAVRTIAPMAFDHWAASSPKNAKKAKEWAAKLRAVAPITDKASAEVGRQVAREARAAAYAADAAAAYADAAAAADAADAAAAAAADAAAAAFYAAYAAAARSKSKDFSRQLWCESLAFLDRLVAVTEAVSA